MYNKQASGQQGFTLIEAMIVVAVIAVLLAVAVPSFSDFFEKNRLKRATEEVFGLITKARAEGVVRSADMRIDVAAGTTWCVGYEEAPSDPADNCDCAVANSCAVSVAGTPVTQVVSSSSFSGVTMSAGNDISLDYVKGTASAGSVTLVSGVWKLKIMASNIGRVRICTPDANTTNVKSTMMGYSAC